MLIPFDQRRCTVSTAVAAVGILVLNSPCWADPNPYYIGGSLGYSHESNVFRVPTAISDSYTSIGLLGGFDQPIGRERIYATGSVRENRYRNIKELDNTSYSLVSGLDWSTVNKLSGAIRYSTAQSLATSTSLANAQPLNVRNVERNSDLSARVQYGFAALLSLEGSVARRTLTSSAAAYKPNDYELNVYSTGIKYRPSSGLTMGVGLRASRGHYTHQLNASGEAARLERNDVDLTATWIPTGQSTIDARLSFGKRTGDAVSQGDFSGTTGSLLWSYQPTGRLRFRTSLIRDTGLETGYARQIEGQTVGAGDNNRLTTALALTGSYEVSAKIQSTASLNYNHRSLTFTPGAGQAAIEGSDSTKNYSIGASYAPTRNSLVSCSIGRESRSTASVLSYAFSANTVSCSGQLTLQ